MLISNKKIQTIAEKNKFGVGAFNIYDLESLLAVTKAAEFEKSPAILATTEGAINYAGHKLIVDMVKIATKKSQIPFSLHLDHGKNIDVIKKCCVLGYTSVMVDGSSLAFKDNIALTKTVDKYAHNYGVSVEAELGTIGGVEDSVSARKILLTNPKDAYEFVQKTGCDTLAIAIGTSHGAYKFKTKSHLDIPRLIEIKKMVDIPLVLHGASGISRNIVEKAEKFGAILGKAKGVSDDSIAAAIQNGISKINIDSDLRLTFNAAVREVLTKHPEEFDPRHILGPAKDAMTQAVQLKMRLFGSSNKSGLYK